jgi:4'-phosphopantetheinyl transferase
MKEVTSDPHLLWLVQTSSDVPAADDWLSECERAQLGKLAVPKRARDWKLGRWTAKMAVLGALYDAVQVPPLSLMEVCADPGGAPFVLMRGARAGFTLSLSHSREQGFCVVNTAGGPVGCDIEFVETRSAEFTSDYFTPAEVDALAALPIAERPLRATLVWSAKESALKALGQGLRRDTRSVEVSLGGQKDAGGAWRGLAVRCLESHRAFSGWWRPDGAFVLTMVGVFRAGEPRAIHRPLLPPKDGIQSTPSD